MTVDLIAARVREIAVEDDNARAHQLEDALYKDVLAAIGAGAPNAPALARAALAAAALPFARWYE